MAGMITAFVCLSVLFVFEGILMAFQTEGMRDDNDKLRETIDKLIAEKMQLLENSNYQNQMLKNVISKMELEFSY